MQWSISLVTLAGLAASAWASPVDFGMQDWRAAVAERDRKLSLQTELSLDPPGSYRIVPLRGGVRVSGGDLRGLMYGLIAAAEQMRATGTVQDTRAKPALTVRGVRLTPTDVQVASNAFFNPDQWRAYFAVLARSRINQLTLVMPLKAVDLDRIRFLSRTAADYAVDFTLGLRGPLGDAKTAYARLRTILDESQHVRGIEIQPDREPVEFYQNTVIRAVRESGRRVALDVHGVTSRPEIALAALEAGVFLRASADPGAHGYYELHSVLHAPNVTEDPETVRKHLDDLMEKNAAGFEVDAPGPELGGHQQLFWLWGRLGYDQGAKISASPDAAAGDAPANRKGATP